MRKGVMRKAAWAVLFLCALAVILMADDCGDSPPAKSASGVSKADVQVPVGADGYTAEQRNVRNRLLEDNKPGAIKHLYVISPYSGQVILYSTVKGKVTSGGKRLTPSTVQGFASGSSAYTGPRVNLGGAEYYTGEVLQDDGTYGTSGDYLYWWDVRGAYHQHYLTGGQIITVSDQPLPVKSVTINIENPQGEK
jgi:hypothetical protein